MIRFVQKITVCLIFMASLYHMEAQTFNGQGGLLVPPGAPLETVGITNSIATVSGIGTLGVGCNHIENITMDFTHTFVGDVALFLIAPSGEVLELSSGNGGGGNNYSITVFTDFTAQFITAGTPPYNGTFRPEGRQQDTDNPPFDNNPPLGTFTFDNTFAGVNADGDWTLMINDYVAIDVGVLNSWSITFNTGGGPEPEVDLGPDITICPGETATLTAEVDPEADTYIWSNGGTTQSINVSPSSTTSYSVTVANNGCIDADTIVVVVDPNGVVANAGADVSICEGNETDLHATGGGSGANYNWSDGQSGPDITVSPGSTTTYTVTVSDGSCTATDQVVVTVTPAPEADAGEDVFICEGEFTVLTGSGGTSNNHYLWSTGQTGPVITVSPDETTLYTLVVNINGCIDEDEVIVDVTPSPEVDAGNDEIICLGESIDLSATGSSGTYEWSNGEDGTDITVSPIITTLYNVTVTVNGCEAVDDVVVEVIEIFADAGDNQVLCEGGEVELTATGGNSYEWSTGENGATIIVEPTVTTTYFVTVSDGACEAEAEVTVEVNEAPIAEVSPDATICAGESATLTASGGTEYEWSNGETDAEIIVSPTNTTTYTVTVTDDGCSSEAFVTVDVEPAPEVFAGSDEAICAGESVTLTAIGLIGPGTYTWSTGEISASIDVSPIVTTSYTVTVTDENGCTNTDFVTVTITPDPIANAGPDENICLGDAVVLTASGGTDYLWSNGDTNASITVSPGSTTTYSVTVTSAVGCTATDAVNVVVFDLPTADAGSNVFILPGGMTTLTATGGISYLWSTGETTATITVSPPVTTTYSVTVTANGCSAVAEVTVFVNEIPAVNLGPDLVICAGEIATLDATIAGPFDIDYLWSNGDTTAMIDVVPLTNISYSVTVEDVTSGFTSFDTLLVQVQQLPLGEVIITGDTVFCTGSVISYSSNSVQFAETYTWTVSAGATILSGQGTTGIDVDWGNLTTGTVSIVVSNACGSLPSTIQEVLIETSPVLAGPIDGDPAPCDWVTTDYTIQDAQGAVQYTWTIFGGAVIVDGQGTPTVTIDWNETTGGDLCVIASNDCGNSTPVCIPVSTIDAPVANAGPDEVLCGTSLQLQASGNGSWSVVSGPGNVTFEDQDDPQSMISVDEPGSYTLVWTANVSGCEAVDEVTLDFFESPSINAVTEDCNDFNTGYTISLTITGGTAPYMINGNPVAGTVFTSAEIPAGNPYSFVVTDANGCESEEASGFILCFCTSSAGTMSQNTFFGCVDATLTAQYFGDAVTDGNDIVAFVLHDGNFPAGIIQWNDSPEFAFTSGMITGQTYYISVVVANDDGSGLPDLTDPCLAIADGTPIIFHDIPIAIAGTDIEIGCDPALVTLDGSLSSPGLLYQWTALNGGMILGNSGTTNIQVISAGSYVLTVTDPLAGCSDADTVDVNQHTFTLANLVVEEIDPLCADECNGSLVVSGENTWVYALDGELFAPESTWADLCADEYLLSVRDEFGCIESTSASLEEPAAISVGLGKDKTITRGQSVDIAAQVVGNFSTAQWSPNDCPGCTSISVSPEETTIYSITIIDANGCTAVDSVTINVLASTEIYVPTAFSPNGDNINDLLIPLAQTDILIESYEIFDRWGNLVFGITNVPPGSPGSGWDGTFNGKLMGQGVYVYHLQARLSNGEVFTGKGDVTLIR